MRWATARSAVGAGAGGLAAAAVLALLLTRLVSDVAPTNAAVPTTRSAVAESSAAVAPAAPGRSWRDGPLGPMAARVGEMFDVPTLAERSRNVERVAIVEREK